MRVPAKGNGSGLERPKNSASESFGRSDTDESSLGGAKWEQVIRSKVPFEVLEEIKVVFLVVLDLL